MSSVCSLCCLAFGNPPNKCKAVTADYVLSLFCVSLFENKATISEADYFSFDTVLEKIKIPNDGPEMNDREFYNGIA